MKTKPTPIMERFAEVKLDNPGALLLFRVGDFYETFYADARDAASILGLTLTTRGRRDDPNSVPMAGFPYHALQSHLAELVKAGRRVAICEQV